MSYAITNDLLEENRNMKRIFAQIHSMTAPFVDLNANITTSTVNAAEKVRTTKRERPTSQIEKNTSTSVPNQNVNENVAKRQRQPKRSVLPKDNGINTNDSSVMNNIRSSTSSAIGGMTPSPSGPMNTNTLSTSVATVAEAEKTHNADDLMLYLRLKQVVQQEKAKPESANSSVSKSNGTSAPKSNDASAKINPNPKKRSAVDLSTRVTVVIDRLTPAQIAEATGQASVPMKRPRYQQAFRRNTPRRAAPTNLKDISVLDILKDQY